MLKLGRVTKFKLLFLLLVFVFNFDVFKFSTAILEKALFFKHVPHFCEFTRSSGTFSLNGYSLFSNKTICLNEVTFRLYTMSHCEKY